MVVSPSRPLADPSVAETMTALSPGDRSQGIRLRTLVILALAAGFGYIAAFAPRPVALIAVAAAVAGVGIGRATLGALVSALGFGVGVGVLGLVVGAGPISIAYGLLVAAIVGLGIWLTSAIEGARDARAGLGTWKFVDSFDHVVAGELTRARRYKYPVTAVTITVADGASRAQVDALIAQVAQSLLVCLRQSDLLGYSGRTRLVALLPETDNDAAKELLLRLRGIVPDGDLLLLRVGLSSFPDEEVTWIGLQALATSREASFENVVAAEDLPARLTERARA
jgi:hypothetical protein